MLIKCDKFVKNVKIVVSMGLNHRLLYFWRINFMKKVFVFLSFILFFGFGVFAKDYDVEFEYSMLVKSGKGSSGQNVQPIVKVLENENDKADFILPDFVFAEKMTIHSFKIADVDFTKNADGSFSFSKDKFSSSDGTYEISGNNLSGTISSDGKINFSVTYKAGKMPFKLKVKYSGNEVSE